MKRRKGHMRFPRKRRRLPAIRSSFAPLRRRRTRGRRRSSTSFASMSTPRPRIRAIPLRPLLLILLVPLIYSGKNLSLLFPASTLQWMAPLTLQYVPVSRLHPSAPEKGVCLPPPAGPKRPNHLVLGPSAGQGRPDRLQCRGSPSFASGSSMCPV
jgi:hypothetical protein